jgi:hypothetical protein
MLREQPQPALGQLDGEEAAGGCTIEMIVEAIARVFKALLGIAAARQLRAGIDFGKFAQ